MTQLDIEIGHPAARECLSPKVVERLMAATLLSVEAAWLGLLGYGAWWLIFS